MTAAQAEPVATIPSEPLPAADHRTDAAILTIQAYGRGFIVRYIGMGKMVHAACSKGDVQQMQWVLAASPTCVNWQDRDGFTALHWAVVRGQASIVALLLAHENTDVNRRSPSGWTALHIACRQGMLECAEMLVQCDRTDVGSRSGDGLTAIGIAASGGRAALVDLLRPMCNARDSKAAAAPAREGAASAEAERVPRWAQAIRLLSEGSALGRQRGAQDVRRRPVLLQVLLLLLPVHAVREPSTPRVQRRSEAADAVGRAGTECCQSRSQWAGSGCERVSPTGGLARVGEWLIAA
eukprot:CAMPEP_0183345762 /NCGR_PEP_ID=MMETSP0164_2-20130417/11099_1 /TAXON_ID=221442 /ORGANISM="Coccolithus pelagicus ssp braarudi, Strain PLY182g" /LENGTH=294 /DNA_ID=CAMNT_0025516953 /DNA_START=68 /DNA_END=948 /DNA_ORIENTATION=+